MDLPTSTPSVLAADRSESRSRSDLPDRLLRSRWRSKVAARGIWWRRWKRADISFLIGTTLAFVLLPLDAAAWGTDATLPFLDLLGTVPTGVLWVLAVALIVGNTLILDALLTIGTPDTLVVKAPVRHLRLLACGVPLLGLYVINFWQWVLARRPPWAVASRDLKPPALGGSFRRATAQVLAQRSVAALAILWLYGANLLLLLAWSSMLSVSQGMNIRTYETFALHISLHAVVFCCLVDYLRDAFRKKTVERWRRALLWALPPLSLPFALGGVIGLLGLETESEKTLCGSAAYFHGGGARRPVVWAHLQGTLDKSPGHLTALYRLKTFLLALDTLAVGWLVSLLAGQRPSWQAFVNHTIALLTLPALVGAAAVLLLTASRTLVRSLESPQRRTLLDAHAYGILLALGLVAAALGLNVGAWLQQGEGQQAALLVMSLIALGMVIVGLAIVVRPWLRKSDLRREDRHDGAVWLFFFFALLLASGLMALDEDRTRTYADILIAVAVLSPLWHVALAVTFQGWLLRPYRLRMLLGGRYPRRLTWRPAFLLTTLALPLGGLAVPCWIFMRHRNWPSFEPPLRGKVT